MASRVERIPDEPPVLGLNDILAVAEEERTELDKILELLLKPENIAHNTELNRNEILAFSAMTAMAQKHSLPMLKEFLQHNMVLRVSKGRKGRAEWVKIVSRQMQMNDMQDVNGMPGSNRGFFRRREQRR